MPAGDEARVPPLVHCLETSPSRSVHRQYELGRTAFSSPGKIMGPSWSDHLPKLKCKLWGTRAALHTAGHSPTAASVLEWLMYRST